MLPEDAPAPPAASVKIATETEGTGVGEGDGAAFAANDTRIEAVDAASSTDSKMSKFLVVSLRFTNLHLDPE